jgi:hypothetical protein
MIPPAGSRPAGDGMAAPRARVATCPGGMQTIIEFHPHDALTAVNGIVRVGSSMMTR